MPSAVGAGVRPLQMAGAADPGTRELRRCHHHHQHPPGGGPSLPPNAAAPTPPARSRPHPAQPRGPRVCPRPPRPTLPRGWQSPPRSRSFHRPRGGDGQTTVEGGQECNFRLGQPRDCWPRPAGTVPRGETEARGDLSAVTRRLGTARWEGTHFSMEKAAEGWERPRQHLCLQLGSEAGCARLLARCRRYPTARPLLPPPLPIASAPQTQDPAAGGGVWGRGVLGARRSVAAAEVLQQQRCSAGTWCCRVALRCLLFGKILNPGWVCCLGNALLQGFGGTGARSLLLQLLG